jgi:hypothetical protein
MFKDMTLSNTVNEEFKAHLLNSTKPLGELTDLSVRVLTTGYWPGQNSPPIINLPRVPAAAFDIFKNFYLVRFSLSLLASFLSNYWDCVLFY